MGVHSGLDAGIEEPLERELLGRGFEPPTMSNPQSQARVDRAFVARWQEGEEEEEPLRSPEEEAVVAYMVVCHKQRLRHLASEGVLARWPTSW